MKKKEPSSLKILYPAAFHFKEERVLAAHPLSCHLWRVFGCLESGKKNEKMERVKKAGELKASHQFLLIDGLIDLYRA